MIPLGSHQGRPQFLRPLYPTAGQRELPAVFVLLVEAVVTILCAATMFVLMIVNLSVFLVLILSPITNYLPILYIVDQYMLCIYIPNMIV